MQHAGVQYGQGVSLSHHQQQQQQHNEQYPSSDVQVNIIHIHYYINRIIIRICIRYGTK